MSGDPAVVAWMRALENAEQLDVPVARVTRLAGTVLPPGGARDALRGHRWLGHAAHPLLTDFPLGLWTSAIVLDLVGGPMAEPAAQRLTGLGVLAAAPTALSGWAEWLEAPAREKRVGIVHAATNAVGIALFANSWAARRAGAHARGVTLALVGGLVVTVGGYLGGHLTEVRKLSSAHPSFDRAEADPPGGQAEKTADDDAAGSPEDVVDASEAGGADTLTGTPGDTRADTPADTASATALPDAAPDHRL